MFQYLQYVAEHGQSPIQFRFEGASTQVSGDSLRMEMVVENRMGLPVIKLGGDYPAILDGEVTFLHLRTLGAEPLADPPDLIEVKGEGSATVALGDYFEAGDPGRHGWSVVIRDSWRELPGSMGRRQRLRVHGRRVHRRRSGQLGPCQTLRIEAMSSASTPPVVQVSSGRRRSTGWLLAPYWCEYVLVQGGALRPRDSGGWLLTPPP